MFKVCYLKCGLSVWKWGMLFIFLTLSYKYRYFSINVYTRFSIRPRLIGLTEIFMYELNSDIAKVFADAASDCR